MSDIAHDRRSGPLPRSLLFGALALLGFAMAATLFARVSDVGTLHMPVVRPVETLHLRFEDHPDGAVTVRDADDGLAIYTIPPGSGGFIRSTMRGLTRERIRENLGVETPFVLTHWSDGTLSLFDDATGHGVSLDAFGPTNAGAFAQLFQAHRSSQP